MTNDNLSDLGDLGKLPHLSDAISYKNDIAPYRFIEIFAGVGSGKNKLINRFVNGDAKREIPKKIVLVITSRRAKVNELLADKEAKYAARVGKWGNMTQDLYDADDWERFKDNVRIIKDEWGEHPFYQKSVACTNAFIEKYIQNVYDPSDPGTHLWNLFDMIVVDEYHSLVVDASYQTSPYYVNSLIWEIAYRYKMADEAEQSEAKNSGSRYSRPLCEHLILMTGTPDTVKKLPIPYITPHVLDMMDKCINVVPKNIWFLDRKQAKDLLGQKLAAGKRCIYFMNHIQYPDVFCKGTAIPPESIAMSFSDKDRRDPLKKTARKIDKTPEDQQTKNERKRARIYKDMVEVESSISNDGSIPPQYLLLLTTSRNKEGINIKSEDINDVFVESHSMSDIVQMAGRVRHGAENLYVIVDSLGYGDKDYPYENVLAIDEFAPDARKILNGTSSAQDGSFNRHLMKLCKSKGFSDFFANRDSDLCPFHKKGNVVGKYIKRVHKMTDYVRFDFFRNYFCFDYLKAVAIKYLEHQQQTFCAASLDYAKYVKIFQKAFPQSIVHPYKDRIAQMQEYIEQQLAGDPMRTFTKEQILQHIAALNRIRFDSPDEHLQKPKTLLEPIGLTVKRVCNDSKKPGYKRWRYVQAVPQQRAS